MKHGHVGIVNKLYESCNLSIFIYVCRNTLIYAFEDYTIKQDLIFETI